MEHGSGMHAVTEPRGKPTDRRRTVDAGSAAVESSTQDVSARIAAVYADFQQGRGDAIQQVRTWIGAVVNGGRWGFEDPDSVGQEILLRLYRIAVDDKVGDPRTFQKFVYTVSKNACLTAVRRQRRRREREVPRSDLLELGCAAESTPDRLSAAERNDALKFILQQLPQGCRELWILIYQEQLTSAQIAERLGTTAGNVRVRAHRCLERARALFQDYVRTPGTGAKGDER